MKYLLTILIIIGLCICSISPVMAAETQEESDDIIIPDEEWEEESDDIIIPDEEREEESDKQYIELSKYFEFFIDPTFWLNSKVVVKPTNGEGPVFERHTHSILPKRLLLPKSIDEWTIEYYSGAPWKKTRDLKLTSYGQIKLSDYPEGSYYIMECWRLAIFIDVYWGGGHQWVGGVVLTDVKN